MKLDPATIEWQETRYPGIFIHLLWLDEGSSGDAAVLIRMDPGCSYPRHRHVREEDVLILEGSYADERGEYHAGTFLRNPAQSVHSARATGTVPCILFAVARGGIEILRDAVAGA